MGKREEKMLYKVVENYLLHRNFLESANTNVQEFAKKICDIDVWEMWVLTQPI